MCGKKGLEGKVLPGDEGCDPPFPCFWFPVPFPFFVLWCTHSLTKEERFFRKQVNKGSPPTHTFLISSQLWIHAAYARKEE